MEPQAGKFSDRPNTATGRGPSQLSGSGDKVREYKDVAHELYQSIFNVTVGLEKLTDGFSAQEYKAREQIRGTYEHYAALIQAPLSNLMYGGSDPGLANVQRVMNDVKQYIAALAKGYHIDARELGHGSLSAALAKADATEGFWDWVQQNKEPRGFAKAGA